MNTLAKDNKQNPTVKNTANDKIESFTGKYSFLSMEYPCEFFMDAIKFKTVSAAYYAQKSQDINAWNKFARLNPNKARQKAAVLPDTDIWEAYRFEYLYKANKAKFDSSQLLKDQLCETKGKILLNKVPYKEEYLGIFNGSGKNILGKVLMKLRDEYLEKK